jgi:hypothetical protein
MSDALADAARLLIAEASPETVRAVLRLLLDDAAPAPAADTRAQAAQPAQRNGPAAAPRRVKPADPEWLALKARIRAVMTERGADHAALGAAIGHAANTVRLAINRTSPPSEGMRAKLAAWLEASEVATAALPFRAVRAANGAAATEHSAPASTAWRAATGRLLLGGAIAGGERPEAL